MYLFTGNYELNAMEEGSYKLELSGDFQYPEETYTYPASETWIIKLENSAIKVLKVIKSGQTSTYVKDGFLLKKGANKQAEYKAAIENFKKAYVKGDFLLGSWICDCGGSDSFLTITKTGDVFKIHYKDNGLNEYMTAKWLPDEEQLRYGNWVNSGVKYSDDPSYGTFVLKSENGDNALWWYEEGLSVGLNFQKNDE